MRKVFNFCPRHNFLYFCDICENHQNTRLKFNNCLLRLLFTQHKAPIYAIWKIVTESRGADVDITTIRNTKQTFALWINYQNPHSFIWKLNSRYLTQTWSRYSCTHAKLGGLRSIDINATQLMVCLLWFNIKNACFGANTNFFTKAVNCCGSLWNRLVLSQHMAAMVARHVVT